MAVLQRLTDDELKALAERLLAPEMADLGFQGVDIEHRDDFDGDPSLHVGPKVGADVPAPFDPRRFQRIYRAVFDAMLDLGDERIPHMMLKRDGDESPEPDHISADP